MPQVAIHPQLAEVGTFLLSYGKRLKLKFVKVICRNNLHHD